MKPLYAAAVAAPSLVAALVLSAASSFAQDAKAPAPDLTPADKAIAEVRANRNIKTPEERTAAVDKALEPLDAATISTQQLEIIVASGLPNIASDPVREKYVARLQKMSEGKNVDGAVAAMLKSSMVKPPKGGTREEYTTYQGEQTKLCIEASKHPQLGAAFAAGHGMGFLRSCAMGDREELGKAGVYKTVAPLVTEKMSPKLASSVLAFLDPATSKDSGLDKPAAERLRKVAVALADKAIADEKTTKQEKKSLENAKARATGAFARGELLDHQAPPISFIWSNSPTPIKNFSDFKGKVVFVDFWATWCGPCVASFPHLRELQERYKDSNVVILGVTSPQGYIINQKTKDPKERKIDTPEQKDELAKMPDWIKDMEMTWTVAFSEDSCFNPQFGVNGIPHIALIDAKGIVRYNELRPGDKTLTDKIDSLLKESNLPVPASHKKEETPEKNDKKDSGHGE
jgi:thiol-disulfide isomerase/thioredoxin